MNESDTPGPDDLPDIRSDYTKIRERNQDSAREFMEKHYITIIEILMLLFLVLAVYAMVANKTIENKCNDFYQNQFKEKYTGLAVFNQSLILYIQDSGNNQNKAEKYDDSAGNS